MFLFLISNNALRPSYWLSQSNTFAFSMDKLLHCCAGSNNSDANLDYIINTFQSHLDCMQLMALGNHEYKVLMNRQLKYIIVLYRGWSILKVSFRSAFMNDVSQNIVVRYCTFLCTFSLPFTIHVLRYFQELFVSWSVC